MQSPLTWGFTHEDALFRLQTCKCIGHAFDLVKLVQPCHISREHNDSGFQLEVKVSNYHLAAKGQWKPSKDTREVFGGSFFCTSAKKRSWPRASRLSSRILATEPGANASRPLHIVRRPNQGFCFQERA